MKLAQNACLGNCSDVLDWSDERSRAILALLFKVMTTAFHNDTQGELFSRRKTDITPLAMQRLILYHIKKLQITELVRYTIVRRWCQISKSLKLDFKDLRSGRLLQEQSNVSGFIYQDSVVLEAIEHYFVLACAY
jgi:hypothetical protein